MCPSCGQENIEGEDRCVNCSSPLRDVDIPRADQSSGWVRSVMEEKLGALEQTVAVTTHANESARDAARRMNDAGVDYLLVVNEGDGAPVGILTAHDYLHKSVTDDASLKSATVGEMMTAKPEVLGVDDTVASAISKLAIGEFSHLPVVYADGTYGIISVESVMRSIAHEEW